MYPFKPIISLQKCVTIQTHVHRVLNENLERFDILYL